MIFSQQTLIGLLKRINANVTLNTTIPESCPAANMFRVG